MTPAEAYQKSMEALNNARIEYQDKVRSLESLERTIQQQQEEIGKLKNQVRDYQSDIIRIEQNVNTKITEEVRKVQETVEQVNNTASNVIKNQFPPGTPFIREIHPLALATDSNYIDVNGEWTNLTRLVYSTYESTTPLPNSQRKYQLIIRQGNNGIQPQGHTSKYRLYYGWVGNADNIEYPGDLNWGHFNEGGWDTITLDHILNPFNLEKHGCHYWHLQGLTFGCINRVYSVVLAIVDLLT